MQSVTVRQTLENIKSEIFRAMAEHDSMTPEERKEKDRDYMVESAQKVLAMSRREDCNFEIEEPGIVTRYKMLFTKNGVTINLIDKDDNVLSREKRRSARYGHLFGKRSIGQVIITMILRPIVPVTMVKLEWSESYERSQDSTGREPIT